MKYLRASFLLILLVGLMGLLTACGGDTATATVAVTTEATATTAPPAAVDTPTTAAMVADTPTTAAMAADTPTTAAMAADTPTTSTGSTGTVGGIDNPTLQAAATAMKGVTSYHFSMTTETASTGAQTIEGDSIPPDKTSLTTKFSAAGQTMETQTIIIGSDIWTNIAGQWTKTSMGANPMANPSDLMSLGQVSDVQDLGDDTVDGIATKHLSYKSTMADPTGATAGTSGSAEIWIDKATNYIVQLKSTSDTAVGTATVTIKYSRFNDPSIKIEPPQ